MSTPILCSDDDFDQPASPRHVDGGCDAGAVHEDGEGEPGDAAGLDNRPRSNSLSAERWLRDNDPDYVQERRYWNPPKYEEPRGWKPRMRPPLEARNWGGFHDDDGTWIDAKELMNAEPLYGRKDRAPLGDYVERDFLQRGGWTIRTAPEQKREELRERLREWLPQAPAAWGLRGPGRKEWERALARHKKHTGRWRVIFLYARWGLTQEDIAERFGGIQEIPKSAKTIAKIIHDEEKKMLSLETELAEIKSGQARIESKFDHKDAMDALRWQRFFEAAQEGLEAVDEDIIEREE